jgi:pyruvate dehydrogenase E2 component (dihydrolipoamide acetyltransferase)
MATPVIMPRQGQSVETCIISRWYKAPGEIVKSGDILFSYETDKASFDLEAETNGVLIKRLFEEGDEVPVLQIVAYLGAEGESIIPSMSESKMPEIIKPSGSKESNFTESHFNSSAREEGSFQNEVKIKASPRARNRAANLGLPLENIPGTGPNGRIMDLDVIKAAEATAVNGSYNNERISESKRKVPSLADYPARPKSSPEISSTPPINNEDSEIIKISSVRKIIARKMHESLLNSAQLTNHTSADARALLQLRKKVKDASDKGAFENVTINDMVCFATIKALKKHPDANSHFLGDSIRKFRNVHLGIAIDTERGLMVPAVRNAENLTIRELSSKLRDLANNCRKGNIDPELLSSESASFTVSNLGAYGVELFTPVINLPQVAILGLNSIIYRPADLGDGLFGFLPYIGLSLTYDHRAIDGAPAAAFLRDIKLEIEKLDFEI